MQLINRQRTKWLAAKSDAQLLRLTRDKASGDAYRVFYDRHTRRLYSFLRHHTADDEVAVDLMGESFAIAYLRVGRFDASAIDPRDWLLCIARFVLLSSYHHGEVEHRGRLQLGMTVPAHDSWVWDGVEARIEATLPQLLPGIRGLSRDERKEVVAELVDRYDRTGVAHPQGPRPLTIPLRVALWLRRLRGSERRGRR